MKKILFILLIIVLSGFVNAFSMSPATYRYEYDEINGLYKEASFTLTSSSSQTIVLSIKVTGSLENYTTVDMTEIILEPKQSKTTRVKLNIPPNLDKVGNQEARVTFTKGILDNQGGFMIVTTALGGRLVVTFAYPGEYITITKLNPVNVNKGQNTVVNWEVQARGHNITSFKNELIISNEDEIFFSKSFPSRNLARTEKYGESTVIPSETFPPGDYNVLLKSVSSDNEVEKISLLRIGTEDLILKSFNPENFTVGEIVEFSFVVESLWNSAFSNVYGVLTFDDISIITRTTSLKAFSTAKIDKQYIDLRSLEEGVHNGSLTVFFDGNSKTFNVTLTALSPEKDKKSISTLIIISSSLLILIIIIFVLILIKKYIRYKNET